MLDIRSTINLRRLLCSTPLILIAVFLAISLGAFPIHPRSQNVSAAGTIAPTLETQPVPHSGDAADDPAIWIHPTNTAESIIIGTDKQGGLAV